MDNSDVGAALVAKSLEYLGRGVNIFTGAYLEPPNKSRAVDNDDVTTIRIDQSEVTETYGSNFAEFIQNFSVSAGLEGSYGGFSGSVEAKFSSSSRSSVDIKFAQLALLSSGAIVSMSSDPAVLRRI